MPGYHLSLPQPADLSYLAPKAAPSFTGIAGFAGPARTADGTAAQPALAFTADPDTGVYRTGPDSLAIATGGVQRLRVGAGLTVGQGLTGAFDNALTIMPTTHATSERATLFLSPGWLIGQDQAGAGTLDFFLYNATSGLFTMVIAPDDTTRIGGPQGAESLRVTRNAGQVNHVRVTGAVGGAPPTVAAEGADATLDLQLLPKGAGGRLRFGAWTGTADAPVTGYVEIRDAGGTLRRLATVG